MHTYQENIKQSPVPQIYFEAHKLGGSRFKIMTNIKDILKFINKLDADESLSLKGHRPRIKLCPEYLTNLSLKWPFSQRTESRLAV